MTRSAFQAVLRRVLPDYDFLRRTAGMPLATLTGKAAEHLFLAGDVASEDAQVVRRQLACLHETGTFDFEPEVVDNINDESRLQA